MAKTKNAVKGPEQPKRNPDEVTLAEYVDFMKTKIEQYAKDKRQEIVDHKDDWYEGQGPDEYRMDISAWWESFDCS